MKKKRIIILIIIAIILAVTVFSNLNTGDKEEVLLNIPSGSSVSKIAQLLQDEDIIGNAFLFRLYVRAEGSADKIQAGMHLFHQNMSYKDALVELLAPATAGESVSVTIPEGFEVYQIAARMEEKEICSADAFMEAVKNEKFDFEFLKNIPEREIPLEGYLFPDTYLFYKNTSPREVINTMLRRFEEVLFTDEYISKAAVMGYSFDEILTMASVVEREAAGDLDRSKVASVFYNRLHSDYNYLESCATVQYILRERKPVLSYEDTKIDSPYNTYLYPGLPVGPIASPGKEAFHAALYPATTDYRYFVVGKNGEHIFSKTYEEHLNAQGK